MADDVLLVSEVFRRSGRRVWARLTEAQFASTCVECGTDQQLEDAHVGTADSVGLITAYRCGKCNAVLIETGHWGFRVDENRDAYRVGDYAVYMTSGMRMTAT